VSALAELSYAAVPADACLCLMRAVRHLHESAARATKVPIKAIGADLLQPLLVLAAVRLKIAMPATPAPVALQPPRVTQSLLTVTARPQRTHFTSLSPNKQLSQQASFT
jgi:hypothetical protein